MATVLERVSTLIVDKLGVDAESIKPEATFAEDLNADSLDLVELIMAFEEQFSSDDIDIEISDEDIDSIISEMFPTRNKKYLNPARMHK